MLGLKIESNVITVMVVYNVSVRLITLLLSMQGGFRDVNLFCAR